MPFAQVPTFFDGNSMYLQYQTDPIRDAQGYAAGAAIFPAVIFKRAGYKG
jgi:hypothetical protein